MYRTVSGYEKKNNNNNKTIHRHKRNTVWRSLKLNVVIFVVGRYCCNNNNNNNGSRIRNDNGSFVGPANIINILEYYTNEIY
jgi:hypothetical protein